MISVARVLFPKPIPSAIPAAIAITFFTTPATSQPTTSGLVYTRRLGWVRIRCSSEAIDSSGIATTVAAGWPAMISRARFGPVITPTGRPGISSAATSVIRLKVSRSMPFERLMTGTHGRTNGAPQRRPPGSRGTAPP